MYLSPQLAKRLAPVEAKPRAPHMAGPRETSHLQNHDRRPPNATLSRHRPPKQPSNVVWEAVQARGPAAPVRRVRSMPRVLHDDEPAAPAIAPVDDDTHIQTPSIHSDSDSDIGIESQGRA